jgi:poly-gamma-glutamate synthesis protein (capsule biosynthesis protein)
MPKKTVWFILVPLVILDLALAILCAGCYWRSSNSVATSNLMPFSQVSFWNFAAQKSRLPKSDQEVSLIAVGDVSFSRGIERAVKKNHDINYPLAKMRDYLAGADLTFGNLETPITPGSEIPAFTMLFRSNPGTELALKDAGFSIVSLANNHTLNFGAVGLKDTFKYLTQAGIKYVGAGLNFQAANQPVFLESQGIKFAFLAFNDADVVPDSYEASDSRSGTAFMRSDKMIQAVKSVRPQADVVIVSMHSGTEYVAESNDSQVQFARAAIDAGADLVLGHHPHVVQTMEQYKGKYIFYSLGNFVFDQSWSRETTQGLAVKIYFRQDGVSKISFLPVIIESNSQPRPAASREAEEILSRLKFSLAGRLSFVWDSSQNNFVTSSQAVIYPEKNLSESAASPSESADLNQNLIPEIYTLDRGRLSAVENSKVIWQSPEEWWIEDFALADSNNDGTTDLNLSLWKAGNFGTSQPFWIEVNDPSIKNHFFVLNFLHGTFQTIWGSSNLSAPNCEFKIEDIDGDHKNDLVVIEGDYAQKPACRGDYVAVWKWNDWGFTNEWRSAQGNYFNLEVEKINEKSYIAVDSF